MKIEPLHPVQLARLREMTPQEKWAISKSLLATATEVRRAVLREQHPDWSAQEIEREIARERASGRT
jgi:hypothetical protein